MLLSNLEIALLAAGISIFINYCLGKPGSSEFSPYEIFSTYTVWLSKWRLEREGLYEEYWQQCVQAVKKANKQHEIDAIRLDMRRVYYNAAQLFFTWERAFGMCIICSGFWISLLIGLLFTINFLSLVEIIIFSHIIIRILAKII